MSNLHKPKLVILTTHFGKNFSGGSTVTCEVLQRIENEFSEIEVFCTEAGHHDFSKITFHIYSTWFGGLKKLILHDNTNTVYYGDFYNSILYVLSGKFFYFTYHDNWPELGKTSLMNKIKSLYFSSIYKAIFKKARHIVSVSAYKDKYIKNFNKNVTLIRNGFQLHKQPGDIKKAPDKIIMVGSIDRRKYAMAVNLFSLINHSNWSIDIYGRILDKKLADQLKKFNFVNLKGFEESIPYSNYSLLLHTSLMENLPIVFCEAIANNLPVICFDVGGCHEIINTKNGILIKPYEIVTMYDQIENYMFGDLTFEVDQSLIESYSWDKAASAYKMILI